MRPPDAAREEQVFLVSRNSQSVINSLESERGAELSTQRVFKGLRHTTDTGHRCALMP
jgi:hypothetical protein